MGRIILVFILALIIVLGTVCFFTLRVTWNNAKERYEIFHNEVVK